MFSFLLEDDIAARGWEGYLEALEEERRKIQVFQRELPLCLELVTRTIESYKCHVRRNRFADGKCEEEIVSGPAPPVLEEFMPVSPSSSSESNQHQHGNSVVTSASEKGEVSFTLREKSDWLHSAQLWNQSPGTYSKEDSQSKRPIQVVARKASGAFQPFCREKHGPVTTSTTADTHGAHSPVTTALSTTAPPRPPMSLDQEEASPAFEAVAPPGGGGGFSSCSGGGSADREGLQRRKISRRCWSQELHRRFLDALQQLGGAHVATPKQIRELMKVDGLTNDEVKSHLQKYRLHAKGSSSSTARHSQNSTTQAPQLILVGSILLQPHASGSVASSPISFTQIQELQHQSQSPLQPAEEEGGSIVEGIRHGSQEEATTFN